MQESAEMYIETIYVLSQKGGIVRSIDVAEYMGYSKPSVSVAVSNLKKNGYLQSLEDGSLKLTKQGEQVAQRVYERHDILTRCFEMLGVSKETAEKDACKVEHVISDETLAAIKKHMSDK
jgi:Mn-dependent DtxR family transcriptional regulator